MSKAQFFEMGDVMAGVKGEEADAQSERTALGFASHSTLETVERFGRANGEYVKAYTGVDQQTGRAFAKGLKKISTHGVDADNPMQSIKQQAGFSAEVMITADENVEAIINRSNVRGLRMDDVEIDGVKQVNHKVIDRVKVDAEGNIIHGSDRQTKFVSDRGKLLGDVTNPEHAKHRYHATTIELPSEQFHGDPELAQRYLNEAKELKRRAEGIGTKEAKILEREARKLEKQAAEVGPAKDFCRYKAKELRDSAAHAEANDRPEAAEKMRERADIFEAQAEKIVDAGITRDEAIEARLNPKWVTAKRLHAASHRAGFEAARLGAIIGGSTALLLNLKQYVEGDKDLTAVAVDTLTITAKSACVGYATGYIGAFGQGLMQQSERELLRNLAKANPIPAAINLAVQCSGSVRRLVAGEIDEAQFFEEIGQVGSNAIMSSMMAAAGQIAIPIPVVGGLIGGFVGATLSGLFYQHALAAAQGKKLALERLAYVRKLAAQAEVEVARQRYQLQQFMEVVFAPIKQEGEALLAMMSSTNQVPVDVFAASVNQYAERFGKRLQFFCQEEFDGFMQEDAPLRL